MKGAVFVASCALFLATPAGAQPLTPHQQLTRDIYAELIAIRTVHPDGANTAAARAVARGDRRVSFRGQFRYNSMLSDSPLPV